MSTATPVFRPPTPPRAMRVTFWGVQGSCPVNPNPVALREYARHIAVDTLRRAMDDIRRRYPNGVSAEELLDGQPTPQNLERYQQRLGLPELSSCGGETTCVEVETSEGNVLIFDAGSGIRRCSLELVQRWSDRADRTLYLFGSHEHLDHRMGFSFARFCYATPNPFTIHVHGSGQFLRALDQHYGIFSRTVGDITYLDDPVDYTVMPARFTGTELCANASSDRGPRPWALHDIARPIRIGSTTVSAFPVYHVTTCCLAYRIEHDGRRFVFCTDHELRRGGDRQHPRQRQSEEAEARLREHCRDADLLYSDGQYFLDEYEGRKGIGSFPPVGRIDWGHSCVEDVIDRSLRCNVRYTLIGHHDPERAWSERLALDRHLAQDNRGRSCHIRLADSDMTVEL